ncbi:Low complexity witha potential C2C2 zinc ribbon [Cryptosporidium sp. chipmunk genotype I]|uniref:Low complexity witha potential C2C2 zinc ribbon n=1 Tax=Cryptosporidium sp. chipmunk genotype I TaxID=1280935 RepID=UPI00351A4F0A|nr:Low complexity witha potential C2C2 zinc ribbon [Cryptosporidium sp. chipmunk genotype I]
MEELINDIENISINSNNADESNIRDSEKNDNFYDYEVLLPTKSQLEDYSVLSLTPVKDSNKEPLRNCILCRDYLSPICKECSNHTSKTSRKNKKNKIIPDGKVKALARQFEDILPETINNSPNFSVVNDDCMFGKGESVNYQVDISLNSVIEHVGLDISDYSNSSKLENVSIISNEDFGSHNNNCKITKNQLTPIIDPNLCEQIDPIKAITTSSNSYINTVEKKETTNCKSAGTQVKSITTEIGNLLECSFQENDSLFDKFESLSPLEQRALLLKWITETLKTSEASSKLSDNELQEIIKILKGIVDELEYNEKYITSKSSLNNNAKKHQPICNNHAFNGKDEFESSTITRNELKIPDTENSKVNLVNFKLQINIGIPEDEEIEEEHINKLMFKKYNHFGSNFESNSVIIDGNSLSPKSEIVLDDEKLVENSIKEIGNNFFGFFK